MSEKLKRLWKRFSSRKYREAFVTSHLATNIAAQISTMREERGWTQQQLADAAGMKQSRIPVLEDPSNQGLSLSTVRRIAVAFDVAVVVRFVPFSQIARWATDSIEGKYSVPPFKDDTVDDVFSDIVIADQPSGVVAVNRIGTGRSTASQFSVVASASEKNGARSHTYFPLR